MQLTTIACVAVGIYAATAVGFIQWRIRRKASRETLKKKFPYRVTSIGHRGGSLLGPENTMYTFTRAISEGLCDMLELDVRESKDGVIVVSHNNNLGATCGPRYATTLLSELVVGNSPANTLPLSQRSISLEFKTDTHRSFVAQNEVPMDNSTRICLLSQVFEQFPGVPLHVDIKTEGESFVKHVLDLIAAFNRETITFVGSSNTRNGVHIAKYFSGKGASKRDKYRLFGNTQDFFWTHLCFYAGVLPLVSLRYDVFSIPVFTKAMRANAVEEFGRVLTSIGCFFFTSPILWKYLQTRGVVVVGWVVNDECDMAEAVAWPLNGIMSDDPVVLHRYLRDHADRVRLFELGV